MKTRSFKIIWNNNEAFIFLKFSFDDDDNVIFEDKGEIFKLLKPYYNTNSVMFEMRGESVIPPYKMVSIKKFTIQSNYIKLSSNGETIIEYSQSKFLI